MHVCFEAVYGEGGTRLHTGTDTCAEMAGLQWLRSNINNLANMEGQQFSIYS